VSRYTYRPPMTPLPAQVGAAIGGRSWDLAATIDRPAGGGGVLYATGTENSGLSLFVRDDRLVFDYNYLGDHHIVTSDIEVPEGPSIVGVEFRRTGEGGQATLVIDAVPCGSVELPFVVRIVSSIGPSVGYDHGSPVSEQYDAPFPFEGRLERLDIDLRSGRAHEGGNAASDERASMSRQ
jgi:hypothetical protein